MKYYFIILLLFLIVICPVNASDNIDLSNVTNIQYVSDSQEFNNALISSYSSDTVIYLDDANYSGSYSLNSSKNLYLVGSNQNNVIFDGNNSNRIFTVSSQAKVFLVNLTFINGWDESYGGAIHNNGNLNIINCTFKSNSAGFRSLQEVGISYGGAIYNTASLNISSSTFENNHAGSVYQTYSVGGAIFSNAKLNIDKSIFDNNYLEMFDFTNAGKNSRFNDFFNDDDRAVRLGSAVCAFGDDVLIRSSVFSKNTAIQDDPNKSTGHIYYHYAEGTLYLKGNNVKVINSSFNYNECDFGAGVFFKGNNFSFISCNFTQNEAYFGSALLIIDCNLINLPSKLSLKNTYSNLLIENCNFNRNTVRSINPIVGDRYTSSYIGGNCYLKVDNIIVSNSNFDRNTFESTYDIERLTRYPGGALDIIGNNNLITNSSFTYNWGFDGGAIKLSGYDDRIINSSFSHNTAFQHDGGAVSHSLGNMEIDNCIFENNNANGNGGAVSAIYNFVNDNYKYQNSTYKNSIFVNNQASNGGAIFDSGNEVKYYNLSISNNKAKVGGGLYNDGAFNLISNVTFIQNIASGDDYSNGGALFNLGNNLQVTDSNFTDNACDNWGGAILNSANGFKCTQSSFSNNTAFKGGSIYLMGDETVIRNNTFIDNFAYYGGAIYNSAVNTLLSFNSFNFNSANVSGGSVYNEANNLTLYGNEMKNSKASLMGVGLGDYIFTKGTISYLTVQAVDISIYDKVNKKILVNVMDNMGNPVSGGSVTFTLYDDVSSQMEVIGQDDLIEGEAYIKYGKNLDFGSYTLIGTYSLAAEPVFSKRGNLLSLLSSKMIVTTSSEYTTFDLADQLNVSFVLMDSNDTYLSNSKIVIYENGNYFDEVITNNEGYANYSFDLVVLGLTTYSFVYNGDINHGDTMVDLNINVVCDEELINTVLIPKNLIIMDVIQLYDVPRLNVTAMLDTYNFTFDFCDEDGNHIVDVPIRKYFAGYFNDTLIEYDDLFGYGGSGGGIYAQNYIENTEYVVVTNEYPLLLKWGNLGVGNLLFSKSKDSTGIHVYTVEFKGGLVRFYTSPYTTEIKGDAYFAPSTVSFVLIGNHPSASENVLLTVNASSDITEVSYSNYTIQLLGRSGSLDNRPIYIFDSGKYLGKSITDETGIANFTYNDFFDVGTHTLQFIFPGDEGYLASYVNFTVNVVKNPNKTNFTILSNSSLNVSGKNHIFKGVLINESGDALANKTINVIINSQNYLRNYTIITNDLGEFHVNLDFGMGEFNITFHLGETKFYNPYSKTFSGSINPIKTLLFAVPDIEVVGEDNYLSLLLIDEDYNAISNAQIKLDFYSLEYNVTFYTFSDNSGHVKFKLSLPVGNYILLSSFEGDNYYSGSSVLSNISVYGDYSSFIANKSVFIINNGVYIIKLVDSENNPIAGKNIIISVNGYNYKKITDEEGIVRLNINLNYGIYEISSYYSGDVYYKGCQYHSTLLVVNEDYKFPSALSTLSSVTFKGSGTYAVNLTDIYGNPLVNKEILISIAGKRYTRYSDSNGCVNLDLNLDNGKYIVTSIFKGDSEYQNSNISSRVIFVNENAISTKLQTLSYQIFRSVGRFYNVTLTDIYNRPLSNQEVYISINGVQYSKKTNDDGVIQLQINLNPGSYDVECLFEGDSNYFSSKSTSKLIVIYEKENVDIKSLYSGEFIGKGRYSVRLSDENNESLVGKEVIFTINGMSYSRITNSNGVAGLNINLNPNTYLINVVFNEDDDYKKSTLNEFIKVNSTISARNLVKYYKNESQFYATLIDVNGNPQVNQSVIMNINGVFYSRNTNENGVVKLNINLNPGDYIITVIDPQNSLMMSYNITVLSTIILHNLVKEYRNASQLMIKVLDSLGNPSANSKVEININGVFYIRNTDENGIAILNINLNRGKYIATVKDLNNGLLMSCNVIVINSKVDLDVVSNVVNKGDYLEVSLKEKDGLPWIGEKIDITVNNVTYGRYTDGNGIARLKINLIPGEYLVEYRDYLINGEKSTILRVK